MAHHRYGVAGAVAAVLLAGALQAQGGESAQQLTMGKEEAFFHLMRIYNLTPSTGTFEYPGDIARLGSNYLHYYVAMFDSINFASIRNNEFERPAYAARMDRRLQEGIASVRFGRRYTISTKAAIGEYSFTSHTFPILFDPVRNWISLLYLPRLAARADIVNLADFGYPYPLGRVLSLAMPEAAARRFIEQRTASGGSVDRRVSLTLTYSVLNRRSTREGTMAMSAGLGGLGRDLVVFVHSIDIYGYGPEKLGTILPNQSFEEYSSVTVDGAIPAAVPSPALAAPRPEQARSLNAAGNFAAAEPGYREAVRLQPNNADYHRGLALSLYGQKRYAEAEISYRAAIRLQPGNADDYYRLGGALSGQQRSVEALPNFQEAVRLRPNDARYQSRLGWALGEQRRFAEAEASHREAIRLEPNTASYHAGLGWTLYDQQRFAEAESSFDAAVRLDPANASYKNILRQIRTLRRQ